MITRFIFRAVVVLSLFLGSLACAQTFETLFSFPKLEGGISETMIRGGDGNFYGTSENGGAANDVGVVFRMTPEGAVTVLHSFDLVGGGAQGSRPAAGLVEVGEFYYGVTKEGGTGGYGTIFRISRTGVLTYLHQFDFTTGRAPQRGLVLGADGNLYGTAQQGGTNDRGTIFRITTAGQFTVLHNFGATGAGLPFARMVRGPDGALYGTEIGARSIFRLTTAGALSTVAVLTNAQGNGLFNALAVGADGNFYGAAADGGNGNGTIYRVTPAGAVTVLRTFNGTSGEAPSTGLTLGPDGNFYGTTRFGGATDQGTLFRITPAGTHTLLRSFTAAEGANPTSGLVVHNGLLYGIAGSASNTRKVIFSLTTAGVFTVLAPYDGQNRGAYPKSGMVQGTDGNFYGMTDGDGGVVFRLTPAGVQSVLVRFAGTNGRTPEGALIQARDGNLYGVTRSGGANSRGTIFRLTLGGVHTVLHSIAGVGSFFAVGGLVEGDDGNFYGALAQNGDANNGSIYRLTPQGAFSIAHTFTDAVLATEGANPWGPLLKLANGNFIGTTISGGSEDVGAVFRMTPQGAVTVVAPLTRAAHRVHGGFILGPGGDYFATTEFNGGSDDGTMIKCTPGGVLSIVAPFGRENGATPLAAPVLGRDGNLLGTTSSGFPNQGVVYRMTPAGVETVLHPFTTGDGAAPEAPLTIGSDGALYGSTSVGGTGGGGTVFRIVVAPLVTTQAATNVRANSARLNGTVNPHGTPTTVRFQYSTDPTFATGVISTPEVAAGSGSAVVPAFATLSGLAPGTLYRARIVAQNPSGTSIGASVSFTTNALPAGGSLSLAPPSPVPPATAMTATASGWTDANTPLTYQFFLDGTSLGPRSAAASVNIIAPIPIGPHTVALRVFDALEDFTEVSAAFVVNDPPVARAATLGAVGGTTASLAVAKLLAFATDPNGDALSIVSVSPASAQGGAVTLSNGIIRYTPPVGFSGADSFAYTLEDARGGRATGLVNVTVAAGAAPSLNVVSISPTADGFLVKFVGIPGASYRIQYRDAMNDAWQVLDPPGAIQAGANGSFEHEDQPNPKPASRFYRAIAP